ncbi:MAG: hypothetical protein L0H53_15780 [Candidatus Nitrosocosmicus sp.]|nr:hypothetical protein [Candidatus Nitrosocosmicus sp.]MDN5866993.1 hypothetical protein [Candidatus Nitrosocosmicus sp.]
MRARKPIILIDDSPQSQKIIELFKKNEIEFVKYHIQKFEENCCGELPTTKAPSVIAAEGIFKEESLIKNYIEYMKQKKDKGDLQAKKNKNIQKNHIDETDSAYW